MGDDEYNELRAEVRRLHEMLDQITRQNKLMMDALGAVQQHVGRIDRLESEITAVNQLVRDTDRDTHEVQRKVENIKIPRRFSL